MRILLFGANGQLGQELRHALAPLGNVVCATRTGILADGSPCEVADFDAPSSLPAMMARIAPDVVVNAAAYTTVDQAESEPEAAFRINAEAPACIARACAGRDALLVHYSTDYVFDGMATRPYREDDPISPLGVYGRSKSAGECAVRESGARHMMFRTAWLYAWHGRNFMRTILRLAGERDVLRVVTDQVGMPTPAALVAEVTAEILGKPFCGSGLWHLATRNETSWYGFAQAIIQGAHARGLITHKPRVEPIATSDYPARARRPGYSSLDCSRLQHDFGIELPCWERALARVLG